MKLWIILPLLVLINAGFAQEQTTLYFHVEKLTVKNKAVLDSTFGKRYEQGALETFQLNGYTGLALRDSVVKSSSIHYYYTFENHFEKIVLAEKPDTVKARIRSVTSKDYLSTVRSINKKIVLLENSGYPFAALKIINQREEKNKLYLEYEIDSGEFFIVDKIIFKSKDRLHEGTLLNIINMEPGEIYNESKIAGIDDLLIAGKMYRLSRPAEVVFRKGKAEVYLYIEKENSSDADGYVGFQQDKNTDKLVLNGYINLALHNSLNRAETINLNWKNNPDKTQNLRAVFEYPYILKTPIGFGSRLNLQKQDTSFVRADAIFDLSYLHPYFRFGVFYQLESSSTLAKNQPAVPTTISMRDFKKNTIGITARFSPRMPESMQFYHPVVQVSGGFFNYRSDTLDDNLQKTANNKYSLSYEHVIDFLKYFHLHNKLQFQGLAASIPLSRNELIYFGGLRSIRGFYELELVGNNIWILNNEIEFSPVSLLSFKLLYDYAVFDFITHQYAQSMGFGFGLISGNIKLEIIIANGMLNGATPDFSATKVHIGFKSSF
jgi:hypothetical protein